MTCFTKRRSPWRWLRFRRGALFSKGRHELRGGALLEARRTLNEGVSARDGVSGGGVIYGAALRSAGGGARTSGRWSWSARKLDGGVELR
ncbi:proline-rich receptor-like protein kinase PERK9 [Iris pallida]|uniref:Proline-rich receptor-like protein kinase PERK9 n=1 Tax=Iris pallida TaxID=29817 RepID=A0AAX6IH39_IRIPA|nr:proline-rich receptor-like protein kinase PERK9 [Iris pallida]KAJ6852263.1 proline-rich receptor-like protein kinase PERK9 [Iris pallida]